MLWQHFAFDYAFYKHRQLDDVERLDGYLLFFHLTDLYMQSAILATDKAIYALDLVNFRR